MPKRIPIEDRFLSKIDQSPDGAGCWSWSGHVTRTGYARFSAYGSSIAAHRFAYQHFIGPIPDGMSLDHHCHTKDPGCLGGITCRHRRCVRPDHLRPMSAPLNTSLSYPARKTHCSRGHEFTEANTYVRTEAGNRKRTCRKCVYKRKNDKRSADRAQARAAAVPKPKPTHCRYGHPYSGTNLYVVPSSGVRQCRACGKATEERRKLRRRSGDDPPPPPSETC